MGKKTISLPGEPGERCFAVGERSGAGLIARERVRQVEEEGFGPDHDDRDHRDGQLAWAAVCYAAPEPIFVKRENRKRVSFEDPWPDEWYEECDKRAIHSQIRRLVIAGALLAAEIDRLMRQVVPGPQEE